MSYPKKIVKVRPLGGIVNDIPAFEVAPQFYTSGNNMHFRGSFAERTKGEAKVYSIENTGVQGDGTNHLESPTIGEFDFGVNDDFSVELWFRYAGSAVTRGLVDNRPTGGAGFGIRHKSDGTLEFFVDDSVDLVTLSPTGINISDQNWHHLAMTANRTSDELNVYVDGVISSNSPANISAVGGIGNGFPFLVFKAEGESAFDGAIDEIRVWSDVRSGAEILANKNNQVSGSAANLVGYWQFTGTIDESVGTVQDQTSNDNDLVNTGAGDITYVSSLDAFGGLLTTMRNILNVQVGAVNYWVYH